MIKSILLVDDDPTVLRVTSKVLKARGYDVTLTESPDSALRFLKQDPKQYDCILLDWKLKCPIDGDMIVKIIKFHYPEFSTPIIFVTGHANVASKYLMQIGAFDVLTKPVPANVLVTAIEHAISGIRKTPENIPPDLKAEEVEQHEIAKKIIDAITSTKSVKEAAEKLNYSRATLYRWLDVTGLRKFFIDYAKQ